MRDEIKMDYPSIKNFFSSETLYQKFFGPILSKDEGNAGNIQFKICPDCNNRTLKTENGCDSCMDCGYSKCDK